MQLAELRAICREGMGLRYNFKINICSASLLTTLCSLVSHSRTPRTLSDTCIGRQLNTDKLIGQQFRDIPHSDLTLYSECIISSIFVVYVEIVVSDESIGSAGWVPLH